MSKMVEKQSKKHDGVGVMEEDELAGRWEGLNPEILALIFVRIPVDMMVRAVPLVCKPWMETVAGPYCWKDIDVEDWCRRRKLSDSHQVDSVVRKLVRRSKFTFQRLSAFRLGDPGFAFVSNCGRCLKVLQIPMSEITDLMVLKHAESLTNLTELDISNCIRITSKGIETFGKQCKCLIRLKRNMPPPEWGMSTGAAPPKVDDTEALAIANTMSGLLGLVLGYGRFGDSGLVAILGSCKKLTHLDIRGCWSVEYKGDLYEKCERLEHFECSWIEEDLSEGSSEDGSCDSMKYSSTDVED